MDAEAYADMLPWLVFFVMDRRFGLSVAWAGGSSAVTAGSLVVWSSWRGRRAPLVRVAVVVFVALMVSGFASGWWDFQVGPSRAAAAAALSLAAFVTLRISSMSEPYTVVNVAPAMRDDPRFHNVNREITLSWAIGALLVAVSCTVAAFVGGRIAVTFLGWVTPLALAGATLLWTSRRWELFRLAVDTAVPAPLDGAPSTLPLVPLREAGVVRHEQPPAHDPDADAVIHHFPVRQARNI